MESNIVKAASQLERLRLNQAAPRNVGGCFNCGDKWSWKQPHHIKIDEFTSMIPYCEECSQIISVEKKIEYIDLLIEIWCAGSPHKAEEYERQGELAKQSVRAGG